MLGGQIPTVWVPRAGVGGVKVGYLEEIGVLAVVWTISPRVKYSRAEVCYVTKSLISCRGSLGHWVVYENWGFAVLK